MLRLLIIKEIRDIIGSTKFAVTFGVCSVLVLLVFVVGARSYHTAVGQHEAAKRENLRRMEGITDWIQVRDMNVYLPPQPLSAIVAGVANDIGRTVTVEGRGELTAHDSRYGDEPMLAVFRQFDLEFLFTVVLSLFAILFSFDAVSGEKERGTLRLTFASPVPRRTFIAGKLLGSYLTLVVSLLLPLAAGSALLTVLGVPMTGDDWVRLAFIIGAGFLYLGVFLSLSVLVSAMTTRSTTSFLVLLVVWIVAVLIVPRAAVLFAGRAVDVPSVDAVAAQKAKFSAGLWGEDRAAMAAFRPSKSGDMQAMMQEFQQMMQKIADERDRKMREFASRVNEDRRNRQDVQEAVAFSIARLSPAACFTLAATRLAGTSFEMKQHFLAATERYQKAFAGFMVAKTGMNPGGRMVVMRVVVDDEKKPEPINTNEIPAFSYTPMQYADVAGGTALDIILLLAVNLLFIVGAVAAFLRYDVR
ncbi:MAG: ABC transporter permease subunit [Ignavibacteriae bacterium]|nr:ABC transporter permease subunit [Ignavibacteriota bacterium]